LHFELVTFSVLISSHGTCIYTDAFVFMCVFVYLQKVVCGVDASRIRGVGFDATCSLVVVDKHFQPLAVNCEGRSPAPKLVILCMFCHWCESIYHFIQIPSYGTDSWWYRW